MGLKIVRYQDESNTRWGVVDGNRVKPLDESYESLADFLEFGIQKAKIAAQEKTEGVDLDKITLLSPITQPTRLVCQGVNYSNHRMEAGLAPERAPFNLIFHKADSSLCGPHDNVIKPAHVKLLDYEIEIGLVIRKSITEPVKVSRENLNEYIAGMIITNDISARDVQLIEGQWYKGKSYRTFCPSGPYIYLLEQDEISKLYDLELKLFVNGELRQTANTNQMLYKPEETLTELSETMDLFPGDVLLTGTPGGVALKLNSDDFDFLSKSSVSPNQKRDYLLESQENNDMYLKEGDLIVCEVTSADGSIDLGVQKNKVVY